MINYRKTAYLRSAGSTESFLRDTLPQVPILRITGYTGTTENTHDLPRLSKPFGQAEIAAALAELLEPDDKVVRLPTGRRRP